MSAVHSHKRLCRRDIKSKERQRERESADCSLQSISVNAPNALPHDQGGSSVFTPRPPSSPPMSESVQQKTSKRPTSAPIPQRYHVAAPSAKTLTRPETSPVASRNKVPTSRFANRGVSARQKEKSPRVSGADKLAEALLLERMLQSLGDRGDEFRDVESDADTTVDAKHQEPQRIFYPTHKSVRNILKDVFNHKARLPEGDLQFDLPPGSSAEPLESVEINSDGLNTESGGKQHAEMHPPRAPMLRRKSSISRLREKVLSSMRSKSLGQHQKGARSQGVHNAVARQSATIFSHAEEKQVSVLQPDTQDDDGDDQLTHGLATR